MERILILREKKEFVPELDRVVTTVKSKQYFVKDTNKGFHTTFGVIQPAELQKSNGSVIKSEQGKEFVIFNAQFVDLYKRLRKLPQTIPLKDIGFIIAETGINKDSVVLDAGAGSGALAASLARVVKKVITWFLVVLIVPLLLLFLYGIKLYAFPSYSELNIIFNLNNVMITF